MGEEAKQEEAKVETKPEEKKEEEKKEENKQEEEKRGEEEPKQPSLPPPPPLFILYVDLHCVGCAKKIQRSILRIRGVEGVEIDMDKNEVTIKGVIEPQAVCSKIAKKTKRVARVISPLPQSESEPLPQVLTSQVSGLTTVELNVNMHCEACAEQLKRKILKMRGVQTVVTELSAGKVTVRGTMDAEKLVDYVYRRTKKQAKIVPQPEPPPPPEKKEEENKGVDTETTAAAAAAKEGDNNKPAEEKKEGDEKPRQEGQEDKKDQSPESSKGSSEKAEEVEASKEGEGQPLVMASNAVANIDEESMKRMMYYYYQPMPLYIVERIPPAPQLFSDENPNACCIS